MSRSTQINDCKTCKPPHIHSALGNEFSLEGLQPGKTSIARVMERGSAGEEKFQAIIEADRFKVANATHLNPRNGVMGNRRVGNENLYGFLVFGVDFRNRRDTDWATNNASLPPIYADWMAKLENAFPAITEYDEKSLLQKAVDLEASADRIEGLLHEVQELGTQHDPEWTAQNQRDLDWWGKTLEGLRSAAEGVRNLHEKVFCSDTGITDVTLTIPAQKH